MSTPGRIAMTVDEYLRQVEQACTDLSPRLRHRVLADLEVHLRDHADDGDLTASLGTPLEYARELRAAMGLPEPPTVPPPVRRRRWLLPALSVGVGLAVVLAVIAIVLAATSTPHTSTGPNRAISTPPTTRPHSTPAVVSVPRMVGRNVADAIYLLRIAGYDADTIPIKDPRAAVNTVLAQIPDPSSRVKTGTTVHLYYATH